MVWRSRCGDRLVTVARSPRRVARVAERRRRDRRKAIHYKARRGVRLRARWNACAGSAGWFGGTGGHAPLDRAPMIRLLSGGRVQPSAPAARFSDTAEAHGKEDSRWRDDIRAARPKTWNT